MELHAEPPSGLVDEPVTWRVTDVPSGTPVTLTVTGTDRAGHPWTSSGLYAVGADETLDIPDPQRVFTGMQFADPDVVPVRFAAPLAPWVCRATVQDGERRAETTVQRLHQRASTPVEIPGDGFRLSIFRPDADTGAAAVLMVPGTTGPGALQPRAALLAAHGHPTAVLTYMGEPGLPASLREIPVEIIERSIAALAEAVPAAATAVVVWAASVGTQLALAGLAEATIPGLRAVVAVAPSSVVWQALGTDGPPPNASSLTRGGAPLPWLPLRGDLLMGQLVGHAIRRRLPGRPRSHALRLLPAYRTTLAKAKPERLEPATIDVENIDVPILLIAGEVDDMWPSAAMARSIAQRRRANGRADDVLLALPDTGHFIGPPGLPTTVDRSADLVSGGTPVGTADGERVAWEVARAFLDRAGRRVAD